MLRTGRRVYKAKPSKPVAAFCSARRIDGARRATRRRRTTQGPGGRQSAVADSLFIAAAAFSILVAPAAIGQTRASNELQPAANNVLLGIGALPGIGMQATYIAAGQMYTREALFYADVSKLNPRGSTQVAVAIGASMRIVKSLEVLGLSRPRLYDVHLGVRIGPGLLFGFDEERADRNQRFNLVVEPFVRYTLSRRRLFYIEAGLSRPNVRIGTKL